MARVQPDPVQVVKRRRDAALTALVQSVPYIGFLGVEFDRRGDELTAVHAVPATMLIGNPELPALHGGATAAFLEVTAIIGLSWGKSCGTRSRSGRLDAGTTGGRRECCRSLPKTIGFTVDYLRSGLPRDAYARARVNRSGRRYASVHVEAWQDNRARPFAQATGHFLMPRGGWLSPRARSIAHGRVLLTIALPDRDLERDGADPRGTVDTGVVGQMGLAAPIGAVGLGAIILTAVYWVFGFLRMGTTGPDQPGATGRAITGEVAALLTRALMIGLGGRGRC